VKAAVELGWEILGHNETNSRWLNVMEPQEERQSIARTLPRSPRSPAEARRAGSARDRRDLAHRR